MRAMILCAGLGTRLRPLTERWPKPAIPLLGAPLLRYTLTLLARAGVTGVGINTHHLAEEMTATASAEAARLGLAFEAVHEPVIQGTAGGIRGLRAFLSGDDCVVFNGDILFGLDVGGLIARHRASGAAATMALLPMPAGEKYAAVECDAEGRVRRIAGHGPGGESLSSWHFTGVHVLSPVVFDFMQATGEEDINRTVYPKLLAAGLEVRGDVVSGYWSDLGTPPRYLGTVKELLTGKADLTPWAGQGPLSAFTCLRPDVYVEGDVRPPLDNVQGPLLLEAGAQLHPGAKLMGPVHLARGARVPEGAVLTRCVVLEETVLSPGEKLTDIIAWREHRIVAAAQAVGDRR